MPTKIENNNISIQPDKKSTNLSPQSGNEGFGVASTFINNALVIEPTAAERQNGTPVLEKGNDTATLGEITVVSLRQENAHPVADKRTAGFTGWCPSCAHCSEGKHCK